MLRRGLPGSAGQSLKQGGRVVDHHNGAFVGIDTSKLRNAIAVAEEGRGGDVRFLGEIDTTEAATRKLVTKLATKYRQLTFCYEAGPTGYGFYRLIRKLGHDCIVVAPSLIPKKPGDRVKAAVAQVGCPDRRIDRLCITCCWPSQPFTSRRMPGAISSRR
jgi:hypothetical protein